MSDDPLAVLERELVGAARRHAAGPPDAAPCPAHPPRLRHRLARLTAPALAAAVLLPVLAVVAALTLTSGRSHQARTGGRASSGERLTLRGELAVLRRPQRPSDRVNTVQSTAAATVERPLLRRVLVHPAGTAPVAVELVVSVAARPGAPQRLSTFVTYPGGAGAEELTVSTPVTAAQLRAEGIATAEGRDSVAVVVPDGVARVVFAGDGAAATSVRPRDNVAALAAPGGSADAYLAHMTMRWYDARGRLIRRVGPPPAQPNAQPQGAPTDVVRTPPSAASEPLRSILQILRRPQATSDLSLPAAHTPGFSSPTQAAMTGTPEYGLMRLAGLTSWGQRVFLLPYRPPTPRQIDALPARLRAQARRQAIRAEELFYFLGFGNGGQIGTAADVAAGRAIVEYGGGVQAGRVLPLQLIVVVPDGVQSVGFTVSQPGGVRMHRVPVHGNVATLQVRTAPPNNPRQIVWYGSHGRVLKHYTPPGGGG